MLPVGRLRRGGGVGEWVRACIRAFMLERAGVIYVGIELCGGHATNDQCFNASAPTSDVAIAIPYREVAISRTCSRQASFVAASNAQYPSTFVNDPSASAFPSTHFRKQPT